MYNIADITTMNCKNARKNTNSMDGIPLIDANWTKTPCKLNNNDDNNNKHNPYDSNDKNDGGFKVIKDRSVRGEEHTFELK